MRGEPHPAVFAWEAAQLRALLYATHINQAEILYGIGALPKAGGRTALAAAAMAMFAEDFAGRILPFQAGAAARYPEIVLARRQAGNPSEKFDALIAATEKPHPEPNLAEAIRRRFSAIGRRRRDRAAPAGAPADRRR